MFPILRMKMLLRTVASISTTIFTSKFLAIVYIFCIICHRFIIINNNSSNNNNKNNNNNYNNNKEN